MNKDTAKTTDQKGIFSVLIDAQNRKKPLHEIWFERIERYHHATSGDANLECATRCTGRCCPHAAMATQAPSYTVSHVAIMLPFEMDYILAHTDIDPAQLRRESIEIAPNINLDIGYVNVQTPCPFLTDEFWCRAYQVRPMDCRSFPLVPVFGEDGTLTFHVDAKCPSVQTFSLDYQVQLKQVWENLLPALPMNYRMLYNRL